MAKENSRKLAPTANSSRTSSTAVFIMMPVYKSRCYCLVTFGSLAPLIQTVERHKNRRLSRTRLRNFQGQKSLCLEYLLKMLRSADLQKVNSQFLALRSGVCDQVRYTPCHKLVLSVCYLIISSASVMLSLLPEFGIHSCGLGVRHKVTN